MKTIHSLLLTLAALLALTPQSARAQIWNEALGTNAQALNSTGSYNVALGDWTLYFNTAGDSNTATGYGSLFKTTSSYNTGNGFATLFNNTTGTNNTATGFAALYSNTTGSNNTADGHTALFSNTTGAANTASGFQALTSNSTGIANTATGYQALLSNTEGTHNTAHGVQALYGNTAGHNNTALGTFAMSFNTTAGRNVAVGFNALRVQSFSNGGAPYDTDNVAVGYRALENNQPGDVSGAKLNTAVGALALVSNTTGSSNVACGWWALRNNHTGFCNTAIGVLADVLSPNLENATAIGFGALVNAPNKIRLGNAFVTVIEGAVSFTFPSDRNLKENFLPVDGQEVLRKIRAFPLTSWNYIGTDAEPIRHYGVMAQDFHEAFGHDALGTIGTPTTINSGDMDGILMSAVQELSRENAAMKKELAEWRARDQEREARLSRLEQLIPQRENSTAQAGVK